MRSFVGIPLLGLVVGCAIGVPPGASDDDIVLVPDARPTDARPPVDAPMIDAPPPQQTITLSQTGSQNVEPGSSIACAANDGVNITATRDNSYYRVFRLADFGVNRPFTPTMVSFGVEEATAPAGSQTVQVRLYTLNGALNTANLTSIAGNNAIVPNGNLTTMNVPISPAPVVQPGATLVAEVFSPDGDPQQLGFGNIFFIGTNRLTETAPGYLRSQTCGILQPTTYAGLGDPTFASIRLLLTVTGTY